MKAWEYATGECWAMTEPALTSLLSIAARETRDPQWADALSKLSPAAAASRTTATGSRGIETLDIRQGVAVIPIRGPLFRYANLFTAISGATSYECITEQLQTAMASPEVQSIVLDVDSPGGEVNGCAELASTLYDLRGKKPLVAYASGDVASGAYWIASACDEILVSETSLVGSIGVLVVYRPKDSERQIEVVSSQSPHKRLNPETAQDKQRLQARIDALAGVFIDAIARHRGLTAQKVEQDFGGGDVFVGQQGIQPGLVDRVGRLEPLLQSLAQPSLPSLAPTPGASFYSSEVLMTHPSEGQPASAQAPELTTLAALKATYPELVAQLVQESTQASALDQRAQGQQQERERIGAIVGASAAQGRNTLAQHLAFNTELTPEMAIAALEASPQCLPEAPSKNKANDAVPNSNSTSANSAAASSGFDALMAALPNPAIEPDPEGDTEDTVEAVAQRIASFSKGGCV